jgi:hypothetical protein
MGKTVEGKLIYIGTDNCTKKEVFIKIKDNGNILPYYDPRNWKLFTKNSNGVWVAREQVTTTVNINKCSLTTKFKNVLGEDNEVYCPHFVLSSKDNEVIRLEKAICILGEVLGWPPNFLNMKNEGRMESLRSVSLGSAILGFWPNSKNGGKWEFWLSGLALSAVNAGLVFGTGKLKDRLIMGKVPKDDKELEKLSINRLKGKQAREKLSKNIGRIEKGYKFLVNLGNLQDYIPDDFTDKVIEKFENVLCVIDRNKLENEIGKIVRFRRSNMSERKIWGYNVVSTGVNITVDTFLDAIHPAAGFFKEMGVAAYSDLPFIYQMTDMLFRPYYPSKTEDVTHRKFAVYAIIVEAMVNERKLGWEVDSMFWGRNVEKIWGANGDVNKCVTDYFSRLNITAQEISDAIDILDREEVPIKYEVLGMGGHLYFADKKDMRPWYIGETVFIHKNSNGSYWVNGKGLMYDYIENNVAKNGWKMDRVWCDVKGLVIDSGVTRIGSGTFKNCPELLSVTLREGVIEIGAEAFKNCKKLKSITLPSTIMDIERDAFAECAMLETIVCMAGHVISLGNNAFPNNGIKLYVSNKQLYDEQQRNNGWKRLGIEIQDVCWEGELKIGRMIVPTYKKYKQEKNSPWYNFTIKELPRT